MDNSLLLTVGSRNAGVGRGAGLGLALRVAAVDKGIVVECNDDDDDDEEDGDDEEDDDDDAIGCLALTPIFNATRSNALSSPTLPGKTT